MPTRLPYGISFIKPGAVAGAYTFSNGDQTPSVALGTVFFTATSAITITRFDDGERGKIIFLVSESNGATTIQNSAGGINLFTTTAILGVGSLGTVTTGGNYLMQNREILQFLHNGTDWTQVTPSFRNN